MARRFVTGEDVQNLPEGSILDLPPDAIVTDIAREWIQKKRLKLVYEAADAATSQSRVRVALGSDHAGFEMKQAVKDLLCRLGANFVDFGTHSTETGDYPDLAHAVARAVAVGQAELGIIVDATGIGSAIVANKVPGVRAAPCPDDATARTSREHHDANVLTLASRQVSKEAMAEVVRTFLTAGVTETSHRAHVQKIIDIERKHWRPI
jgi:ribose 5-phosphate isomerase B